MRLTGLASGLDVESMVKELMKAKRTTYDNLIKNRTKVEWQQEDYRSLSTKIVDFRNNKLASFNLSNAITAKKSDLSGDTAALSINSTASSATGSLNVKVGDVATSAYNVYTFPGGTVDGSGNEKTLADLGFTGTGENVVLEINGVEVTAKTTDTLSTLAKAINAKSSTANATALYDSKSGSFSISATKTGKTDTNGNGVKVTSPVVDDNNFLNNVLDTAASHSGSNASATINGITYTQASNRFAVNGVDFTVKAQSLTGMQTTISTSQDTSKIMETIKSFVSEYNSLIESINTELSEARNRTYLPLTSEEKKEMSDKEIEMWEEKARSGTLRGDSALNRLVTELRTSVTSLVGGIKGTNGETISIGITTGSYTEKGKLVLDEAKLTKALESNPDAVTNLFTSNSTGVFGKMSKSAMDALVDLSKKAGTSLTSSDLKTSFLENSMLSSQIRDMKDRESQMLQRLNRLETQYYKQFTAMETAINKFNSQSSTLFSLFSS